MNMVEPLQGMGFTLYESKAISTCLATGDATAAEIAKKSGVPPTKVYSVLKNLEARGILETGFERPKMYSCLTVEELKQKLLEEKQKEEEKIVNAFKNLEKKTQPKKQGTKLLWTHGDLRKTMYETVKNNTPESIVLLSEEHTRRELEHPYVLKSAYKKAIHGKQVKLVLCNPELENASIESLAILSFQTISPRKTSTRVPSTVLDNIIITEYEDLEGKTVGGMMIQNPQLVKELEQYYHVLWEQSEEIKEKVKECKRVLC